MASAHDQQPVQALGARTVRTQRSANAFAPGACTGVNSTSAPSERNTSPKLRLNFASRSCSKKAQVSSPLPQPEHAERLFRDLEFLTPWPGDRPPDDRPVIRGVIDFLWKESDGWHLLALDAGEGRADCARALEASVVRGQLGEPVGSATTFDLRTGTASRLDNSGLERPGIGQEFETLLGRIAKPRAA